MLALLTVLNMVKLDVCTHTQVHAHTCAHTCTQHITSFSKFFNSTR